MKEYYKRFKEFRKDPKKRSISLLIIYGIFFIFVIFYIRSNNYVNNTNNNLDKNDVVNKDTVSNYEYNYEININDEVINIKGVYIDNKELFSLNNEKYYIQDNKVYLNNEEVTVNYPVLYLNYNSLKTFIKGLQYESKTLYKDKNIKYEYSINNNLISNYFNEDNINEGMSNIVLYESEYIDKIEIDLSSYYNVNNYKIIINYNNINNISNSQINELG